MKFKGQIAVLGVQATSQVLSLSFYGLGARLFKSKSPQIVASEVDEVATNSEQISYVCMHTNFGI